tara:strand:- start:8 stop:310 length:303 start_codon:yes stop_codon:yes gene_type:complete
MSNQYHSLTNAGGGETGNEIQTATAASYLHVSASTWGGQSVKVQIKNEKSGVFEDIPGGTFTENASKVIRVGNSQTLRAVSSGSAGSMTGVNAYLVPHYN